MSTNVIESGRFTTASDAISVCSSSDLPAPVVPAINPCGPSDLISIPNGPSAPTPMVAAVVRPKRFHSPATSSGEGSGIPIRSSSRAEDGIIASASSRLTSLTGAIARATRSAQATLTWSASTSPRVSSPLPCNDTQAVRSGSQEMTAAHSSGSTRCDSSRQTAYTPVFFAVPSTCGMPGMRRSARAPSSTSRILGPRAGSTVGSEVPPKPRLKPCGSLACFIRSPTSPTSSATRRAAESGSVPTRARHSSPCCGAQCGSQRTQFQSAPASGLAASTTMCRSRGLCNAAAWATNQRASARERPAGPARPITPSSGSGSAIGT